MNNEFYFWDKYMNLEEEELKLFNFVLQFDFGEGSAEYSCEDLKAADLTVEQVLGCLKFIICGYNGQPVAYAKAETDEQFVYGSG